MAVEYTVTVEICRDENGVEKCDRIPVKPRGNAKYEP